MTLTGLFVRIPSAQADALDRHCSDRGVTKQALIRRLLDDTLDAPPPDHAGPTVADTVLTLDETARLLRVGADAVTERVAAGDLPARRLAGEWRFSRGAVLAWLAAGEPAGTRPAGFSARRRAT